MKRYVKEFAADEIRSGCTQERKERIEKVVRYCEKGLITPREAVYEIAKSEED